MSPGIFAFPPISAVARSLDSPMPSANAAAANADTCAPPAHLDRLTESISGGAGSDPGVAELVSVVFQKSCCGVIIETPMFSTLFGEKNSRITEY